MVCEILKLGNPQLYEISEKITETEYPLVAGWVRDLHDTLMAYRGQYGAGRAVAAPQIGVKKRLLYAYMGEPYVFVNPVLTFPDDETYVLMDDCMSFPGLMVRVERHKRADIAYLDAHFEPRTMHLGGDFSELLQHEYDHLVGILATMRAVDHKSFYLGQMKRDFASAHRA